MATRKRKPKKEVVEAVEFPPPPDDAPAPRAARATRDEKKDDGVVTISLAQRMDNHEGVADEVVELVNRIIETKFDTNQREMLRFVRDRIIAGDRIIVLKAARQVGKSWFLVGLAVVVGLLVPGAEIKYAAPTGKMAKTIVRPHFRQIMSKIPPQFWSFSTQAGEYVIRQPGGEDSRIIIGGCDAGNIESMRGQHAHLVILDECGFTSDLSYAVNDVFMPQTINTRGVIVMASSPAKSTGHPFKRFCDEAERDGRLLKKTIYDNPRITPDEIVSLQKQAKGAKSSTWLREYMAEDVPDISTAVLPNATTEKLKRIMASVEEFKDYETYTSIAAGFGPRATGILTAHLDGGVLFVTGEAEIQGMDTDRLKVDVDSLESSKWANTRWKSGPFRRIANFSPAMQGQIFNKHQMKLAPPIDAMWPERADATRLRLNE